MGNQISLPFARWLITVLCFLILALVLPHRGIAQVDPPPLRENSSIEWTFFVKLGTGYVDSTNKQTLLSDNQGNLHAVWSAAQQDSYTLASRVFYATKPKGGMWTNPLRISGDALANKPDIAMDQANNIYAVWHGSGTFFAYKPHDGTWSDPIQILEDTGLYMPRIEVDASGTVHFIGVDRNGFNYATRKNGNWSAMSTIPMDDLPADPCMVIDSKGTVHVLLAKSAGDWNIYYLYKTIDGQWTYPEQISWDGAWLADLAIDSKDTLYAVWEHPGETAYVGFREKPADGDWGELEKIDSAKRALAPQITANNGKVELVYARLGSFNDRYQIVYTEKNEGENWSDLVPLTSPSTDSTGPNLAVDPFGVTHVFWFSFVAPGLQQNNAYGEFQYRRSADGLSFLFLPDIVR